MRSRRTACIGDSPGHSPGTAFTPQHDLGDRPHVSQRMRVSGLGPFPKCEYRFDGAPADLRQGVLHVKRNLWDHLSVHESVVLQPAQRSGQYLRRDSLKAPLQLPEAQRSLGQCADGQRGPLVGHDVKKIAARALGGVHVPAVPLRAGCRRMAAAQGSTSRGWICRMRLRTSQEIVMAEGGWALLSARCRASTGWARGPRPRSAPPGRPPSAAAGRGRAGRPGPQRSRRPARR